jgi:hypothetical protein
MNRTESVGLNRPTVSRLGFLLALSLLIGMQAFSAYYAVFSIFAGHDDEGHVMAPIDQVRRGKVLGDEVYSNFGPAYVYTYTGFFWLTGREVTDDTMRLITLALWLMVATVCGWICYRVTHRTVVSLVIWDAALYAAQAPFVCDPGHPEEILVLCLMLIPAAAALLLPKRKGWFSYLAGVLVGYTLMCKLNVGLFALAGLTFAMVTLTNATVARVLRWGLAGAAVSAPAILLWRHLDTADGSRLALMTTLAIVAVLAQALVRKSNDFALKHWVWATAGCLGAVTVACGTTMLSGTSVEGLCQIVFLNALRHVETHFIALADSFWRVPLSILSCAASLCVAFSAGSGTWPRVASALQWMIRLLLVVVLAEYLIASSYAVFDPVLPTTYGLILPLLWIGLVPVAKPISLRERAVRSLSVLIAVFHSLVVYPVATTQVGLAVLLFVPVCGIALHDTLVGLAAILRPKATIRVLQPVMAVVVTMAMLIDAACYLNYAAQSHQRQFALALPGSRRLRLPDPQAALYRFLAANLRQPGRTFLTMPGLYSLYFWAEKMPPTGLNAADWMAMLSDQQQQQVIESVKSEEDLWVVIAPQQALKRVDPRFLQDQPLVKYMRSRFQRVNHVGEIELGNRSGRGSSGLLQCVHWNYMVGQEPPAAGDWLQLVCRVPLAYGIAGQVTTIIVVDTTRNRIVASSRPICDCKGTVSLLLPTDASGHFQPTTDFPPLTLDAGEELHLIVQTPLPTSKGETDATLPRQSPGWMKNGIMVARLLGPDGRPLDTLPFLAEPDVTEVPRPHPLGGKIGGQSALCQ